MNLLQLYSIYDFNIIMVKSMKKNTQKNYCTQYRSERDMFGVLNIPFDAYYGAQTARAIKNFPLSGKSISSHTQLINGIALVKLAAAKTNYSLGLLEAKTHESISFACLEILEGRYHNDFVVDVIQGGAGTSTNMNANEVIANISLEHMGFKKGEYDKIHPNNHVNMSQSTNDVYPTAIRIGLLFENELLLKSLISLCNSFSNKAKEFSDFIKMGRTQLQDAVPMTLEQEFLAFSHNLREDYDILKTITPRIMNQVNLGGTAIGTGINAPPFYQKLVVENLSDLSGYELEASHNLIEASYDMSDFVLYSSLLKRLSIKLSKISNDIRLLSSGPRTGFNEIVLPACQAGSSIMPGKINPVIPEAVNQVAFEVIGNDLAVTMASESGQLQLNAMEPLISYKLFESTKLLTSAMHILKELCIDGITANKDHCRNQVENSIGIATVLNPYIGYENSSRVAKLALEAGSNVIDVVRNEGLIDEHILNDILKAENMVTNKL